MAYNKYSKLQIYVMSELDLNKHHFTCERFMSVRLQIIELSDTGFAPLISHYRVVVVRMPTYLKIVGFKWGSGS